MLIASVGKLTATIAPTSTEIACTTAVAMVMPIRIGIAG